MLFQIKGVYAKRISFRTLLIDCSAIKDGSDKLLFIRSYDRQCAFLIKQSQIDWCYHSMKFDGLFDSVMILKISEWKKCRSIYLRCCTWTSRHNRKSRDKIFYDKVLTYCKQISSFVSKKSVGMPIKKIYLALPAVNWLWRRQLYKGWPWFKFNWFACDVDSVVSCVKARETYAVLPTRFCFVFSFFFSFSFLCQEKTGDGLLFVCKMPRVKIASTCFCSYRDIKRSLLAQRFTLLSLAWALTKSCIQALIKICEHEQTSTY